MTPGLASAGSRSFVEIQDAGGRVDEALVHRLVALELGDINVPPNPRFPEDRVTDVSLYCRVTSEDGTLRVEVWDRGDTAGARRVSLQGSSQLVARRAALAAAELARNLVRSRRAQSAEISREIAAARKRDEEQTERRRRQRLALTARGVGTLFSDGAYLLGPELGAQLNRDFPVRIELALRWFGGELTRFEPHAGWSSAELALTPSYVFALDPRWELSLGVPMAVSTLHLRDGLEADDIAGQSDTWSARAGASVNVAPRLTEHVRLDVGLSGGWVLRPVQLARGAGAEREEHELGGGFGQLTLGVLVE